MVCRSFGRSPATVVRRICIPRPSGYCGAKSWIDQSGAKYSATRSDAPIAVSARESVDIVAIGWGERRGARDEDAASMRGAPRVPRPATRLFMGVLLHRLLQPPALRQCLVAELCDE